MLAFTAGCGQLFGLDSPTLTADASLPDTGTDGDTDGDGVRDSADNCPTTPNPDQIDTDGSGIGDACEGCVMLPLRASDDDDSDTLVDTVDNCFGQTAPQSDADADGIGDACDQRTGKDARFCVWTFRPPGAGEDAAFWPTSWDIPTDWAISNSALVHASSPQLSTARVRATGIAATGGIAVDTHWHLMGYTAPATFAITLEVDGAQPTAYACRLNQPSGMVGRVELVRDGTVVQQTALPGMTPQVVNAYVRVGLINENGKQLLRCTVDLDVFPAVAIQRDTQMPGPVTAGISLSADQVDITFDHVGVYKLGI